MGFIDFMSNALGAENIPQLIVNAGDKIATGVAAVNSTRAAHYSKANNKILKEEVVGLKDEIGIISGRTSAIRADVKETNGSISAAVNQFAGINKKLSKKSEKEAEEEKAKAKAEKAKAKAAKAKAKAEAKAEKAKAEADAAAKKAADAAADADTSKKKK